MAVFELQESLKLISRKIWVAANFCNIHTEEKFPSNCHIVKKFRNFYATQILREIKAMKITLTHSVEKYYKMRSCLNIFRENVDLTEKMT